MNSILELFGLFMYVLSLACFTHEHAKMNKSNVFASIKNYKYAHLIQYQDFDHIHRIFNVSTKINGNSVKFLAKVYFSLIVDNDSYDLDLILNNNLMSRSYGITTYSKFGKHTSNDSHVGKTCSYYQGSLRDTKDSKVFVTMCKKFRAIFVLPNGVFNVKPLDNDTNTYILYQSEVPHFDDHFCPEFTHSLNDSFRFNSEQRNVQPQLKKQYLEIDNEFAYVELVLIASKSTCDALSGDRDDIEDFLASTTNVVDAYYQEMNVHVVLVHIELWLVQDYFQTGSTVGNSLGSFSTLRKKRAQEVPDSYWNTADVIHVVHRGLQGAAGVAVVNRICTTAGNGLSKYYSNPAITGYILAHELGHSFGLSHVNDGKRRCPCRNGQCIMDPVVKFGFHVWSECSLNFIGNHFALGAYGCLNNIPDPTSVVFGSGCGNSIIEAGEQCDCGFRPNCKSKCCNPYTCRLFLNATCDIGVCCENCQLLGEGVICREKSGECDLPDVCSGTSPYCPQNIYKEDGTSCLGGLAYCYEGACISRDVLCKHIFGLASTAAHDHSYGVNAEGKWGGNCGLDPNSATGYKACARSDTICGKLLCRGPRKSITDFVVFSWPRTNSYTLVVARDKPRQAVSLVPNGTACGPNMNCQNHQCQRIAASKCNPPCIEGVCDNLGRCRCKNGKLCDQPTSKSFPIIAIPIVVIVCSIAYVQLWGGSKGSAAGQYAVIDDNDLTTPSNFESSDGKLKAANLYGGIDADVLKQNNVESGGSQQRTATRHVVIYKYNLSRDYVETEV